MSAESILVTGAGGFAGSHLLDRLLAANGHVEGWYHPSGDQPSRAARPGQPGRLSWRAIDVLDVAAVGRAIAEVRPSRVYHLAGAADQGGAWAHAADALQVNMLGTRVLLDALARLERPCRAVVMTSAAVYQPSLEALTEESPIGPSSPYGLSKLGQELMARYTQATTGVDVIVCRPFNHIGPGQSPSFSTARFAQKIAAIARGDEKPVLGVGDVTVRRDFTDVRDTVRAYERLMADGRPGETYNVCRGEAFVLRDVLNRLIALSGVAIEVERDPSKLRPNDQPVLLGSYARLHAATGWTPEIPLDRTLADLLEWWKTRL